MDILTLSLIALGVVAVGAIGFLMVKEFRGMSAAKKTAAVREPEKPVASASEGASAPAKAAPAPGASSIAPTVTEDEAVQAASAAETAPRPEAEPRTQSAAETRALARLSIMPASFDREAAVAVSGAPVDLVDQLLRRPAFRFDETVGLYEWDESSREEAARQLDEAEGREARLAHVVRLTAAARATVHDAPGAPAAPEKGWEISEHDMPHFRAAFDFLVGAPGLEQPLVDLFEAIAQGGGLRFEPREATRWLEAAARAAQELGNRKAEQAALFGLGGAQADAGRHEASFEAYEASLAICRELGDRHGEGRTQGNAGLALHRMGRNTEAIERLTEAMEIMRETGDRPREGLALAGLSDVALSSGDYAKAIETAQRHLDLANEIGDRAGQIIALANLGRAHFKNGDTAAATGCFDKQLTLARMVRDLPSEGNALGNLGEVHRAAGNHEKEVECYVRQVEVANLLGDAAAGVHGMGRLGRAHQAAGRSSVALDWFDQQLKLARQIGDRLGEAEALWNAALVVHSRGQTADAITRASAALMIYDEMDSPEAGRLREEIAKWRG